MCKDVQAVHTMAHDQNFYYELLSNNIFICDPGINSEKLGLLFFRIERANESYM